MDVQATERFGAGSVNFVRFGSGEAGKLGMSWIGCGVDSSAAIVKLHPQPKLKRSPIGICNPTALRVSVHAPCQPQAAALGAGRGLAHFCKLRTAINYFSCSLRTSSFLLQLSLPFGLDQVSLHNTSPMLDPLANLLALIGVVSVLFSLISETSLRTHSRLFLFLYPTFASLSLLIGKADVLV